MRRRRLEEQQKEKELELERMMRREEEAARVIQSHWRGYRCLQGHSTSRAGNL